MNDRPNLQEQYLRTIKVECWYAGANWNDTRFFRSLAAEFGYNEIYISSCDESFASRKVYAIFRKAKSQQKYVRIGGNNGLYERGYLSRKIREAFVQPGGAA